MQRNKWCGLFAFPVLFTAVEFLMFSFSPDGTALSIAYSQMDFLPLVQIASVTGILGITFMITFIPSVIAYCYMYRSEKIARKLVICSVALIGGVLLFGTLRLHSNAPGKTILVGMMVMQETKHNNTGKPDTVADKEVSELYLNQIPVLAKTGARIILLPERAITIDGSSEVGLTIDSSSGQARINKFKQAALHNKVNLIIGYTNLRSPLAARNSAMVINDHGQVIADYDKAFLVTGLEHQFVAGNKKSILTIDGINSGIAICKDLDFQSYIRQYGEAKTSVLFVPAWDFVVDDWLHSRMAILRGVENGISEVRAARQGRLTISDMYGRVSSEVSSANGKEISLIGEVCTKRTNTFYTKAGNWLGVVCLILSLVLIVFLFIYRKKATTTVDVLPSRSRTTI